MIGIRGNQVVMTAIALAAAGTCLAQVQMPEGTKVRLRLEQSLSSATAEEGQSVQLSVTEDVKVGETVVIPQGATAVGTITQAVPKRRMGRTGKLDFSIERVVAADGNSVPLRYTITKKEGGSNATRTGIITAGAAVVFWPAAPVFLLMKGKDVDIKRGVVVDVFTDQKYTLQASKVPMQTASAAVPAAGAPGGNAVRITSEPDGAEVELDGAFIGSTPATLQMTPGLHRISVRRGNASWARDVQILPGNSITVNAILTPETRRASAR